MRLATSNVSVVPTVARFSPESVTVCSPTGTSRIWNLPCVVGDRLLPGVERDAHVGAAAASCARSRTTPCEVAGRLLDHLLGEREDVPVGDLHRDRLAVDQRRLEHELPGRGDAPPRRTPARPTRAPSRRPRRPVAAIAICRTTVAPLPAATSDGGNSRLDELHELRRHDGALRGAVAGAGLLRCARAPAADVARASAGAAASAACRRLMSARTGTAGRSVPTTGLPHGWRARTSSPSRPRAPTRRARSPGR